jgi:hypothetical protein
MPYSPSSVWTRAKSQFFQGFPQMKVSTWVIFMISIR